MDKLEIPTQEAVVDKFKGYLKKKAVPESIINAITTADQAETFFWETDFKPVMFAKVEDKLPYLQEIYNYRKGILREPELYFHGNIRDLVEGLEKTLFEGSGLVSVTKIYYILRALFNLRKSLNKNLEEDEGSLRKIKMNLIALISAIEKNGLLEKYKGILFAKNTFLEEIGISIFSEQ